VPPHKPLNLNAKELERAFAHPIWAEAYPPILSVVQAAALAQVPPATIYSWSSQGKLSSCAGRAGKHLRIWRDRFIQIIFE